MVKNPTTALEGQILSIRRGHKRGSNRFRNKLPGQGGSEVNKQPQVLKPVPCRGKCHTRTAHLGRKKNILRTSGRAT